MESDSLPSTPLSRPAVVATTREAVLPLSLDGVSPVPLSLAQRGLAAEKEFARLEAARKRAMSPQKRAASTAAPYHRTPRSAFDSRLADVALSQRSLASSHRTPRSPIKVLGERIAQTSQGEEASLCTGSLLHAYGGLGLRRHTGP